MKREKLTLLEDNIAELEGFRLKYSLDTITKETTIQWALRYGLLESIQIVIDISCNLVAVHNLGNAQTYSDCIDILERFSMLDKPLAAKIKSMAGLRNILVHEYVKIDIEKLYQMLDYLGDFREFAKAVRGL
jgi:uncharacterized protein YutE (UPF0331/DUF86 family)